MDDRSSTAYHESSRRRGTRCFIMGPLVIIKPFPVPWRVRGGNWIAAGLSKNCSSYLFGFLRRTISLICPLPLDLRFGWACPCNRGHTLLLPLLHTFSSLLLNKSLPLTVFHFCTKGNRKKELDKNYLRKLRIRNKRQTHICGRFRHSDGQCP